MNIIPDSRPAHIADDTDQIGIAKFTVDPEGAVVVYLIANVVYLAPLNRHLRVLRRLTRSGFDNDPGARRPIG
jgi:hypothetical protein